MSDYWKTDEIETPEEAERAKEREAKLKLAAAIRETRGQDARCQGCGRRAVYNRELDRPICTACD